jgi:hypothetical protein
MEYILITTMVVGLVELVKRLFDRDYRGAIIILGATVIGALCGYFNVEVQGVVQGIVVGLGAAGVVTVAQKV